MIPAARSSPRSRRSAYLLLVGDEKVSFSITPCFLNSLKTTEDEVEKSMHWATLTLTYEHLHLGSPVEARLSKRCVDSPPWNAPSSTPVHLLREEAERNFIEPDPQVDQSMLFLLIPCPKKRPSKEIIYCTIDT